MKFRTRIAFVAALAVAVAVGAASAITYVVVRDALYDPIDQALRDRAAATRSVGIIENNVTGRSVLQIPPTPFGGAPGYLQLVTSEGDTVREIDASKALPVGDREKELAAGEGGEPFFVDATVDGTHLRILTVPLRGGGPEQGGAALQIARPLDEVDDTLARVRKWLIVVALAGVALAGGLGTAVAGAALVPVRRLTRAAEHVSETRDLSQRIDADGRDELSRLASTFNTMLEALEESSRAQRQLVSDASHELRTPLTSIRTNIEVLARDETMSAGEREHVLREVTEQLGEMTVLVAELVELARGDHTAELQPEDVRLDLVAASTLDRARRNWPAVRFDAELEETLVRGVPSTIERALSNLLDNAAKWSPDGGSVEVAVRDGEVVVRDHGPGIADEDLPFVFDRFYRAPSARGMPGSGLGLAIVKQVADTHGGSVRIESAEGGGTCFRLSLPVENGSGAPEPVPAPSPS